MKYVLNINQESSTFVELIKNNTNIEIKSDLYSGKITTEQSKVLYAIYDSKGNAISFFNKVNSEKTKDYKWVAVNALDTAVLALSRMRGLISINVEQSKENSSLILIKNIGAPGTKDNFDEMVGGSKILSISTLECGNFEKVINRQYSHDYNFAIVTICPSWYDEGNGSRGELLGYCLTNKISAFFCSMYKVSDEAELYGCSGNEFIDGVKEFDFKKEVVSWLCTGKICKSLSPEFYASNIEKGRNEYVDRINSLDQESITNHEWNGISLVIIRGSGTKGTLVMRMKDFLNAADLTPSLLNNMLTKSKNFSDAVFDEIYLEDDQELHGNNIDVCIYGEPDDRINLLRLHNIFDFKHFKFNLINGKSE